MADDDHTVLNPAPARGNKRVLVVDDDPAMRKFVMTVLKNAGYDVTEVRNGAQAIELIQQTETPFDLVLSDVIMPQIGGRILARQISELQPETRVLLMSGYPNLSSVLHEIASHAEQSKFQYHFISKPFAPRALLGEVSKLLNAGLDPN